LVVEDVSELIDSGNYLYFIHYNSTMWIFVLTIIGFVLSLYAFYVERQLREVKHYVPLCDIRDDVSCSKAFSSRYGHLGMLPNSLYGMFFYAILFVLALAGYVTWLFVLSSIALAGSLFLAYISFVKMRNYCLVCCGIYVVNVLLFFSLLMFV
jgi:vitamin-K-epoxide reductase (warfarin-sensitive)